MNRIARSYQSGVNLFKNPNRNKKNSSLYHRRRLLTKRRKSNLRK